MTIGARTTSTIRTTLSWIFLMQLAVPTTSRELDEIYHMVHLTDLIFPTSAHGVAVNGVVLVVHSPGCNQVVRDLETISDKLPHTGMLLLLSHDYETFPRHVWYKTRPQDRIELRYKMAGCSEVFFFPVGSTDNTTPEVWTSRPELDMDLLNWIWSQMATTIKVENLLQNDLVLTVTDVDNNQSPMRLTAGTDMVINSSVASVFTAVADDGRFVGGWKIGSSDVIKITEPEITDMNENTWLDQHLGESAKNRWRMQEEILDHAFVQLLNFKQPLFVPGFTKDGFKKTYLPDRLMERFREEYLQNRQDFSREGESNVRGSLLSISWLDTQRPHIVSFSDDLRESIIDACRVLLEEWCDCELELTAFYGIREYFKGSVLRMHVDQMNTHAISAIMQISRDLDGAPDWPLEIIKYDGVRQNLTTEQGEILLYESARLPHGRPSPFLGRSYANAFIHYRPKNNWPYRRDDMTLRNGNEALPLLPLADDVTLRGLQQSFIPPKGSTGKKIRITKKTEL